MERVVSSGQQVLHPRFGRTGEADGSKTGSSWFRVYAILSPPSLGVTNDVLLSKRPAPRGTTVARSEPHESANNRSVCKRRASKSKRPKQWR